MEIVETKIYTKYITELLTDDQYSDLQKHLVEFPKSGDVIKGSGNLESFVGKVKEKVKVVVFEIFTTIMKMEIQSI